MGRRAGLKILWRSPPCGFESHSGHSSEDSLPGCYAFRQEKLVPPELTQWIPPAVIITLFLLVRRIVPYFPRFSKKSSP